MVTPSIVSVHWNPVMDAYSVALTNGTLIRVPKIQADIYRDAHKGITEYIRNNPQLWQPQTGEPGTIIKYNDLGTSATLTNKTLVSGGLGVGLIGSGWGTANRFDLASSDVLRAKSNEAFEAYYQAKRGQLTMDIEEQRYSRRVVERQRKCEGRISMFGEFKAYVSEHRNWIFTILIVAVVDAFFLGGALKQRITSLLGGSLKVLERKVNADLDGDGVVGPDKSTE